MGFRELKLQQFKRKQRLGFFFSPAFPLPLFQGHILFYELEEMILLREGSSTWIFEIEIMIISCCGFVRKSHWKPWCCRDGRWWGKVGFVVIFGSPMGLVRTRALEQHLKADRRGHVQFLGDMSMEKYSFVEINTFYRSISHREHNNCSNTLF